MGRKQRTRAIWLACALLLFISALTWRAYTKVHREHMNRVLIEAIKKNDTASAIAALHAGADPNACDVPEAQRSFLDLMLDLLLSRRSQQTAERESALWLAVKHNNTTIVLALLSNGAKGVNDKDSDGRPMIVVASGASFPSERWSVTDPRIIHALVQYGADVNARTERGYFVGWTALMSAALHGYAEIVEALLKNGTNMTAGEKDFGETALMLAVESGDEKTIKVLIDHGADLKARVANGKTALRRARDYAHSDGLSEELRNKWAAIARGLRKAGATE